MCWLSGSDDCSGGSGGGGVGPVGPVDPGDSVSGCGCGGASGHTLSVYDHPH